MSKKGSSKKKTAKAKSEAAPDAAPEVTSEEAEPEEEEVAAEGDVEEDEVEAEAEEVLHNDLAAYPEEPANEVLPEEPPAPKKAARPKVEEPTPMPPSTMEEAYCKVWFATMFKNGRIAETGDVMAQPSNPGRVGAWVRKYPDGSSSQMVTGRSTESLSDALRKAEQFRLALPR